MKTFTPQEIEEFVTTTKLMHDQFNDTQIRARLLSSLDIITYLQQRENTLREALIPLTDAYLNDMQARCDAATRGPWDNIGIKIAAGDGADYRAIAYAQCGRDDEDEPVFDAETEANANFIATARTDMPRLIATARSLRTALNGDN